MIPKAEPPERGSYESDWEFGKTDLTKPCFLWALNEFRNRRETRQAAFLGVFRPQLLPLSILSFAVMWKCVIISIITLNEVTGLLIDNRSGSGDLLPLDYGA